MGGNELNEFASYVSAKADRTVLTTLPMLEGSSSLFSMVAIGCDVYLTSSPHRSCLTMQLLPSNDICGRE